MFLIAYFQGFLPLFNWDSLRDRKVGTVRSNTKQRIQGRTKKNQAQTLFLRANVNAIKTFSLFVALIIAAIYLLNGALNKSLKM